MAKSKKPVKKPVGRPSRFDKRFSEEAYKLCLLGATDDELADFFKVTPTTINNWKHDHKEFFESIKRGKIDADANVANRLYQRALGFEHDDEEIKVLSLGTGMPSAIERVPVRKIYPPDPTSAIFWLKNRQPKKWRDKQEIDHTTKGESLNEKISPEEAQRILEQLSKGNFNVEEG